MGLAIDVKNRKLFIGNIGDNSIKIINIDPRQIQVLAGNEYSGLQDSPLLESSAIYRSDSIIIWLESTIAQELQFTTKTD